MTAPTSPLDIIGAQLAALQRRFPEARIEVASDGQRVLVVPNVSVGPGWNKDTLTVRVLLPVGYPHVKPDCFYTDGDLRLAAGAAPANGSLQSVFGGQYWWFSWHINNWNPNSGSLDQYVRVCQQRFKEIR
jgi:hypothetical protein